ncbi:MAG: PQQ-dependent sugar dehydrogenase [bacterium]|nr:PQQ-dependent sugar dehydrogenase [bacterium]
MSRVRLVVLALLLMSMTACNLRSAPESVFQATIAPLEPTAPPYTPTPTPTETPAATTTPTETPTPTLSPTPEFSPTPSNTPLPSATPGLTPPTLPAAQNMPAAVADVAADFAPTEGWSCGDFPCADDVDGFLQRIRVPAGFTLEHVGRLPGQPMQITYGPDGRLYATVLEDGTRSGAVYAMNPDGSSQRYFPGGSVADRIVSPIGLAFQPGTDVLYVSARVTPTEDGRIWQIQSDGTATALNIDLPCCYTIIDNQPNGLIFGADGFLYVGVGSLTDRLEPADPRLAQNAEQHPLEAAIVRIQPHTGLVTVFASGIRNPYDLTLDSTGQMYATDNGLVTGPGDRLLKIDANAHYGWPFWGNRGCVDCPANLTGIQIAPDLLRFADYSLPRGVVAYTGSQFPANYFDSLFVALWNGTPSAQRVVRVDPRAITDPTAYQPEPFVTGLIRPVDVAVAPDGSLVVADFIYGHVWRVRYTG